MPKRIRDLTALTPVTGDYVAIDRPGGATGRATIAADPTPNTLALRNAQGAVQDGAVGSGITVQRVRGIYGWGGTNKWLRLVRWNGFAGTYKSISADLYAVRGEAIDIGSRLRVRVELDESGQPINPMISVSRDNYATIANAILLQTDDDTYELWAQFRWGRNYISGMVITGAGTIELQPYGDLSALVQDTAPTPVPNRLYLEWATATVGQTFPGPGNIVAASRMPTSGYIRYDNGIQVCWATITVGSGTWTYPAAFASTPRVLATVQDSSPRLVTITSVSTTAAGVLRTDLSGNTMSGAVHLWAIGLWK